MPPLLFIFETPVTFPDFLGQVSCGEEIIDLGGSNLIKYGLNLVSSLTAGITSVSGASSSR